LNKQNIDCLSTSSSDGTVTCLKCLCDVSITVFVLVSICWRVTYALFSFCSCQVNTKWGELWNSYN